MHNYLYRRAHTLYGQILHAPIDDGDESVFAELRVIAATLCLSLSELLAKLHQDHLAR